MRLKLESGACTKTDNEKHLVKHFRFQIVVGLKVSFGCSIIRIQLQTNPGFHIKLLFSTDLPKNFPITIDKSDEEIHPVKRAEAQPWSRAEF